LLQELAPEADDQRLVRGQSIERGVRVDRLQRFLTRAVLQAEPNVGVPDEVVVRSAGGGADGELGLGVGQ
jgi:hypothetical protein